jgi:proline iminopeptidase
MRIEQFVADLDELVRLVQARFGQRRAVILAHSWGTAPGLLYAARHPQTVLAYIGVSQVTDMPEGERLSLRHALDEAIARQNQAAERELRRIGAPPHGVDAMLVSRKWNERFGGSFHGNLSTGALIWRALGADEVDLCDLWLFGRGNRWSLERLWPEFSRFDVTGLKHLAVPVFLVEGRHDWQVPSVLAASWFHRLEAPCKRLFWFEDSAHNAPFEQSDAFVAIMADRVVPLAASACADQGLPLPPRVSEER